MRGWRWWWVLCIDSVAKCIISIVCQFQVTVYYWLQSAVMSIGWTQISTAWFGLTKQIQFVVVRDGIDKMQPTAVSTRYSRRRRSANKNLIWLAANWSSCIRRWGWWGWLSNSMRKSKYFSNRLIGPHHCQPFASQPAIRTCPHNSSWQGLVTTHAT